MIKKIIILLIIFIPLILNAFASSEHYEEMFNSYRKVSINSQIKFLSGKHYPEITNAIIKNVYYKFDTRIISIIWQESRFQHKAISPKYPWGDYRDYGLMMISDYFWTFDKTRIFNPDYNINLGYNIYISMLHKSNYDIWYSFKYYNGSSAYANAVMKIYYKLKINCEEVIC